MSAKQGDSLPMLDVIAALREGGLTPVEIGEAVARTGPGREDEYDVLREILARSDRA